MKTLNNLGEFLGKQTLRLDDKSLAMAKGASDKLNSSGTLEVGVIMSKFACEVFKNAGDEYEHSTHRYIYEALSKKASWHPSYNRFITPIFLAIGKQAHLDDAEELMSSIKEASFFKQAGSVASSIGQVLASGDNLLLTLAIPAILAGAAGGSLMWGANKLTEPSDTKHKLLLNRRNYYENLAKNLDDELKKQVPEESAEEKEVRKKVEDINDYLV